MFATKVTADRPILVTLVFNSILERLTCMKCSISIARIARLNSSKKVTWKYIYALTRVKNLISANIVVWNFQQAVTRMITKGVTSKKGKKEIFAFLNKSFFLIPLDL
jgi:hypothetical protein